MAPVDRLQSCSSIGWAGLTLAKLGWGLWWLLFRANKRCRLECQQLWKSTKTPLRCIWWSYHGNWLVVPATQPSLSGHSRRVKSLVWARVGFCGCQENQKVGLALEPRLDIYPDPPDIDNWKWWSKLSHSSSRRCKQLWVHSWSFWLAECERW